LFKKIYQMLEHAHLLTCTGKLLGGSHCKFLKAFLNVLEIRPKGSNLFICAINYKRK
jgi:hypothetical protein